MLRARLVVLACLAGCGVRTPAVIDVDALLRVRGAVEARRDLVIRIAADPRDVAAQLALAALDERIGRPSEAIDALEAVVALGGPLGVRWHPEDRARLARLIAARGRTRLARGSATALADLERARTLGAAIGDHELTRARIAAAIVALRHSDRAVRAAGRAVLAELSGGAAAPNPRVDTDVEARDRGARGDATSGSPTSRSPTSSSPTSRSPTSSSPTSSSPTSGSATSGSPTSGSATSGSATSSSTTSGSPTSSSPTSGSPTSSSATSGSATSGSPTSSSPTSGSTTSSSTTSSSPTSGSPTSRSATSSSPTSSSTTSGRNAAPRNADSQTLNADATGGRSQLAASMGEQPAVRAEADDPLAIDPSWVGARAGASPAQRGRFGTWLWQHGARRAAWDELTAWRTSLGKGAAFAPEDLAIAEAYVAAARWWTPLDQPAPAELPDVAQRCAFGTCAPREVVGDAARERAYLMAPIAPALGDPAEVAAVAIIALHQALRGEVAWGAAIAARIDLAAFATPAQRATLPGFVQPVIAQLAGGAPAELAASPPATADERLVLAAGRALAGAPVTEVAGLVGDAPGGEFVRGLVMDAAAAAAPSGASWPAGARAEAAARHASRVVPGTASVAVLRDIAAGFARDPVIADRLARDAVASASDAAAMHASVAAVFDALGDPARARAAWQAAVDGSREPWFLRGLAEAQARQGDGDAALITATSAAAASGDPAVVWTRVAEALAGSGRFVQALEAARSAIDLAGPEVAAEAFTAAIVASRALGRDAQAAALADRRARIAPGGGALGDRDASDPVAALAMHRREPGDMATDRLWRASRWDARHVELRAALLDALARDDPRRQVVLDELVELAGDGDCEHSRSAAAAIR